MKEQLCFAAYVPFSQLPERLQRELQEPFLYLVQDSPDDYNTQCFFKKDEYGYYVEVTGYYQAGEPPECETLHPLLTAMEVQELDLLIVPRVCDALIRLYPAFLTCYRAFCKLLFH